MSTTTLADFEAFMDITGYADENETSTSPAVMAEAEAVLV